MKGDFTNLSSSIGRGKSHPFSLPNLTQYESLVQNHLAKRPSFELSPSSTMEVPIAALLL